MGLNYRRLGECQRDTKRMQEQRLPAPGPGRARPSRAPAREPRMTQGTPAPARGLVTPLTPGLHGVPPPPAPSPAALRLSREAPSLGFPARSLASKRGSGPPAPPQPAAGGARAEEAPNVAVSGQATRAEVAQKDRS
ncbi:neural Wiskott-Aldrich syndrome protein-like [Piliocolobus tephrosceles]|uniref:neural Wiskott-Aldrich syndrome protein-like n=1 Tax=Piliocolobus tephrosceles TaxID=591936 RepID=UPI000C2A5FB3|nr:neural Wiskott-Aldrich syndrome protein-like [Piliocolobus tephrosceles]